VFQNRGQRKRISIGFIILVGIIAFSSVVSAQVAGAGGPDREDSTVIFAQDVFVIVGSTLGHPDDQTASDAPLFTDSGIFLDMTWGQWQQANATSTARVQGGKNNPRTTVDIHLTGLVPGGVYSLFYGTLTPDSENPLCPGVERTLPLTSVNPNRQQPDASSFVADTSGQATYRGQVDGDLFSALQVFYTVIYHFDGQTYDPLPNRGEFLTQGDNCRSSFGQDAMRQLIIWQKF
jgi:hypothetical protein